MTKQEWKELRRDVCAGLWPPESSSSVSSMVGQDLWDPGMDASAVCRPISTTGFRKSWEGNAARCFGPFTRRSTGRIRAGRFIRKGLSWPLRWLFPHPGSSPNARCQRAFGGLWKKTLPRHDQLGLMQTIINMLCFIICRRVGRIRSFRN